jgi:Niemann-Pick C1 protein
VFFKIFFIVVACGLFHGLVFLPVMLSLIGPKAHISEQQQEQQEQQQTQQQQQKQPGDQQQQTSHL